MPFFFHKEVLQYKLIGNMPGEPLTIEFPENMVIASNTVHHNEEYSSRVIAPLVAE